jgi:hypothetical protein
LLMNGQMDWVDGWMTSWIYEVEYPAFFISWIYRGMSITVQASNCLAFAP